MLVNCHSNYSRGYGTIRLAELAVCVAEAGYVQMALTDINSTAAVIDFVHNCNRQGMRPVAGVDFRNMEESAGQLYIMLAANNEGYYHINAFLSRYLHNKQPFPTRAPQLPGTYIIYPFRPGIPAKLEENEYLGIKPEDVKRLPLTRPDLLRRKGVILHTLSFSSKSDYYLHCLLRAVDRNTLLSKLEARHAGSRDACLVPPDILLKRYEAYPWLAMNTENLMARCSIDFDFRTAKNPISFTDSVASDRELLHRMCWAGLERRYPGANAETRARLRKELDVIEKKDFMAYFLTAWDVVYQARQRGFPYVGRGSGANSIAAYCLEITEVDPIELNLFFERFLNMYRSSPPDFDIDFSWTDRDEMIAYILARYNTAGKPLTASMLGSWTTYKRRAMIRELGKVYGLPKMEIDSFEQALELDSYTGGTHTHNLLDKYKEKILAISEQLRDFPHHLSVHASGIVISGQPLHNFGATDMPPKGFPVTQFDMYTAESKLKLHKLDILSQRGLGHIHDCIKLVKQNRDIDIDIADTKRFMQDGYINDMLKQGHSIGCFYIESPAMRLLIRKLKCDNYSTLVAASSIIRPGVADSGMAREYVKRSRDPQNRRSIHPLLDDILADTYGVMVYQEDVIKVAHKFGGLSLEEADLLRRAMAWKFRVDDGFDLARDKYFDNCRKAGYPDSVADEVWRQMISFAGFSFCKAHSASYAVESYQSLYLKAYYPLEFMVAVLNNFGGFYNAEFYINEARREGATIHPPCINRSQWLTTLHGTDIYLGFVYVKHMDENFARKLLAEREVKGDYNSLQDLCRRLHPSQEQLLLLVNIGSFRFTGFTKRQLLWEALILSSPQHKKLSAADSLFPDTVKTFNIPILPQSTREDALQEINILGFPVCSRFDLLVEPFRGDIKAADMPNNMGQKVKMVGYMVTSKHSRTKRGEYMQFASFLDDEGGNFETVLFPPVFRKYPISIKGIYLLEGRIMSEFDTEVLELSQWRLLELSFDPNIEAGMDKQALNITLHEQEDEGIMLP